MIHRLYSIGYRSNAQTALCDGRWVMAVPLPFFPGLIGRAMAAWAVLTGEAHAFVWPKPGELEELLRRSEER